VFYSDDTKAAIFVALKGEKLICLTPHFDKSFKTENQQWFLDQLFYLNLSITENYGSSEEKSVDFRLSPSTAREILDLVKKDLDDKDRMESAGRMLIKKRILSETVGNCRRADFLTLRRRRVEKQTPNSGRVWVLTISNGHVRLPKMEEYEPSDIPNNKLVGEVFLSFRSIEGKNSMLSLTDKEMLEIFRRASNFTEIWEAEYYKYIIRKQGGDTFGED